jgi:glycosyltransferase involved in cell wall biosynthesis
MKILVISHFIPYPPHGGAIQRTFNLLKVASKYNDIHLVCFSQKLLQTDIEKRKRNIEELRKICREVVVIEIPSDQNRLLRGILLLLNLFSATPFDIWRYRSRKMAAAIRHQLDRNKFDIFHAETLALAQYKSLAPNLASVLVHHNVESAYILRRGKSEKNPLAKFYLYLQGVKTKNYERKIAPHFGKNITVSDFDMAGFRRYIPEGSFAVISNGTDPDYFKPTSEPQEQALIFTGGMTWYPNRDAMIYFCRHIYPLIKEQKREIKLDIIGRKPPNELKKMAAEDNSINLYGYVEDTRGYVSRAAVYVVPIRVGGGTRLKILDAFAAGKAVVSTTLGCEGIDVTPNKDILIGDTPQEFADQVIRLLDDENLRRRLGCEARKLIEDKYSWEIIGTRLNDIYKGLCR